MTAARGRGAPVTRLAAMAAWLPRVLLFVARLESRFARLPLHACLESITPAGPAGRPRLEALEIARVIWNVLRWDRGRFNNGCFVRSLTRYHFFRRLGHPVVFRLGIEVREPAATEPPAPRTLAEALATPGYTHLRSHAWLTLDGEPFLEFEPARFARYRVLFTWPAAAEGAAAPGESTAPGPGATGAPPAAGAAERSAGTRPPEVPC